MPCHGIIPFYTQSTWVMADWIVTLRTCVYFFRIFWYVFTAACANTYENHCTTHCGTVTRIVEEGRLEGSMGKVS